MYKNEILENLWLVKDEIAQENDYDVRKLCQSLNKKTRGKVNKQKHESITSKPRG